jgi:hypothetical protein
MTRRPHERTHQHALALLLAAGNIPAALEHLNREEASLDGYSASVWPDGLPRGSGATDPVTRLLEARYTVRTAREDLRDCIEAVCQTIDSLVYLVNKSQGVRVPRELRALPTCGVPWLDPVSATEIPCPKIAVDHRYAKYDPDTGTTTDVTVDGYCDDHWNALCPRCHERPKAQYRETCDRCRKQIERSAQREDAA